MTSKSMSLVAGAVITCQLVLAAAVAAWGAQGPVPVHFNLDGQANGWADRGQIGLIIAGIAAVNLLAIAGARARRRRLPASDQPRGAALTEAAVLVLTSLTAGLMASLAFGQPPGGLFAHRGGPAFLWLLMAAIGAIQGKVPPNLALGVRTPWTLSSRLAWDKSNRLAGRLFFWGGLVGLAATPFIPPAAGLRLGISVVLIFAGLAVLESWRVWRRDPDRRPT